MKKSKIILLLCFLATLSLAWYFKNSFVKFYQNAGDNLAQISTIDVKKTIEGIKENGLTPQPLRVGGKSNQVVLTKEKVIAQTNIARYDNGMMPPLTENATLNVMAFKKAQDMFAKQYFEHVSPSGVGPTDLAKREGYQYILEGENLILGNFGNEKEMLDLWMNSPGHRANILHDRYTEIGVAVLKGLYEGETVWIGVQEFGLPLDSCPLVDTLLKDRLEVNKEKITNLATTLDTQKQTIESTPQNSPNYNALIDEYNALVNQYNSLNQITKKMATEYNSEIAAFNVCLENARGQ